jgi:hypothetical protein
MNQILKGKASTKNNNKNDTIKSQKNPPKNIVTEIYDFLIRKQPLFLILIVGALLRIISFTRIPIIYDGAWYADTGFGILKYGTFSTASQNIPTWGDTLIYPAYLSVFYRFFGYSLLTTRVASLIIGLLAILVVYKLTANIFDKKKGLIVAAIIAFHPWAIIVTGANVVENMLIIFLSFTIWSIIKSSDDRRYLSLAGIFASLTFLTKTNIGISLIILVVIFFFVWQVYYNKKRALMNPHLIFFIVIVMITAIARNYMISTMSYTISEANTSIPHLFTKKGLVQLIFQLPFHILLPATFFLFFLPETSHAISNWKKKNNNLLLLVILGGTGVILLHAVARQTWLATLSGASERYFIPFIIPTMWLFLGYLNPNSDNSDSNQYEKKGIITKFIAIGGFIIKNKKISFISTLLLGIFILILVDLWWGVIIGIGSYSVFLMKDASKRTLLIILAFLIAGTGSTLDYNFSMQIPDAMEDAHNIFEEGDIVAIDSNDDSFSLRSVSLYLADIDIEVVDYNSLGNDSQSPQPKYILSQTGKIYENHTLLKIYNDTSPLFLRARIYISLKRTFLEKNFEWPRHPPIELWVRD